MSEHILIGAKKAVISAACGICALPESELLKRLEELYLTGFKAAVDVTIKDHGLYHRVNEMLAILGAEGEIDTRHKTVTAVMDCLHDIDGGMYEANRRAPSAEQQQQEPVAWRYKDAGGHWRYVGTPLTEGWVFPGRLDEQALYTHQQPQAQITVRVKRDPVSGELLADDKPQAQGEPIDMVLYCPECHEQHIDAPDPDKLCKDGTACSDYPCATCDRWRNPPHRSHLCKKCGCIWRPADAPTNGVAAIKTKGKADTWDGKPRATVPDVDKIMAQAQVFASSWSLVGGQFDDGSMLKTAEQEKEALRQMLTAAAPAQPGEGE